MSLTVLTLPIFKDNYVYILKSGSDVALVDPGDFQAVDNYLKQNSLTPTFLFNTHHHWDHVDGNLEFKKSYSLPIYCSDYDKERVPGADVFLKEGDRLEFGDTYCEVLFLPGHTLGHIAYYFPKENTLFCGDTLFSLGCGRLFEGSYEQMYASLQKIQQLPNNTQIYCTHEYTLHNANFATEVDAQNKDLHTYIENVKKKRALGEPSIPTDLDTEKKCNPFLRCHSSDIKNYFHLTNCSEIDVFKQLRDLRNRY